MTALSSLTGNVLFFDLETNGLLDSLDRVLCAGGSDGPRSDVTVYGGMGKEGSLQDFAQKVEEADYLVGHNIIGFDLPALRKVYPDLRITGQPLDTMVLAKLAYPHLSSVDAGRQNLPKKLWGRHALMAWGQRLGVAKDDYQGGFDEWNEEMHEYCRQDVRVTQALFEHLATCDLSWDSIVLEHAIQTMCVAMEEKGVLLDEEAAMALYSKLETRRIEVLRKLQEVFPEIPPECLGPYGNQLKRMERMLEQDGIPADGWKDEKVRKDMEWLGIKFKWTKPEPFNPNSGHQIAKRMMALGWEPTEFTDTGIPKVDEPVLVRLGQKFEEAKPLAEYVMLQKRLGQIRNAKSRNGWLDHLEEDGRVHGRINTVGCVSFRCSHSMPNLAQVPAVGKPYGKECRSLFGVADGNALVGVDASGLELRVLAHYLAQYDGGRYAHEVVNGDIHTSNQEAAGLPTRNDAKRFIYALIYGAGDVKLGETVLSKEKNPTKLRAAGKKVRAQFLKRTPALRQLTEAVRGKATRYKKLKGLDGRVLHVRSVHSSLNLLLQSAGAIICKRALVIMRQNLERAGYTMGKDWDMVLFIHDEAQVECRKEIAKDVAEIAEQSFEQVGRDLGLRVATAGEAKIGSNWAETH